VLARWLWRREVDSNSAFRTTSYARRAAQTETGILNDAFSLAVNDGNAVNSLTLRTNPSAFSNAIALFVVNNNPRHLELLLKN
jgi:hypothetical protein